MEKQDKSWGKKLTGGMVGAIMVREIVMAVPSTAWYGIWAITIMAVVFMGLQYLSDRKDN